MNAGDAFYFRRHENHLWIVLSDPAANPQQVLLVNMTTWRADKDQACLLNAGDHPCVLHNSVINSEEARVCTLAHLHSLVAADAVELKAPVSPALLQRIRAAAADSKRMQIGAFQLLLEQGLVEE